MRGDRTRRRESLATSSLDGTCSMQRAWPASGPCSRGSVGPGHLAEKGATSAGRLRGVEKRAGATLCFMTRLFRTIEGGIVRVDAGGVVGCPHDLPWFMGPSRRFGLPGMEPVQLVKINNETK